MPCACYVDLELRIGTCTLLKEIVAIFVPVVRSEVLSHVLCQNCRLLHCICHSSRINDVVALQLRSQSNVQFEFFRRLATFEKVKGSCIRAQIIFRVVAARILNILNLDSVELVNQILIYVQVACDRRHNRYTCVRI